jgi:hypothetical protein
LSELLKGAIDLNQFYKVTLCSILRQAFTDVMPNLLRPGDSNRTFSTARFNRTRDQIKKPLLLFQWQSAASLSQIKGWKLNGRS